MFQTIDGRVTGRVRTLKVLPLQVGAVMVGALLSFRRITPCHVNFQQRMVTA